MVASAHGAGLMLVPALIPICLGDPSSRPSGVAGALLPALAAVALHGAAMLAVTGAIAAGACGGSARCAEPGRVIGRAFDACRGAGRSGCRRRLPQRDGRGAEHQHRAQPFGPAEALGQGDDADADRDHRAHEGVETGAKAPQSRSSRR